MDSLYTADQMQDFYKNYRESLSRQYEVANQALEQQRRNAYGSAMASANKAGMLYSNFPERTKIQYDMNTYTPALTKLHTAYRTGLDTLRDNIASYQNSIADIQEAIAHLNSMQ